MLAKMPPDTFSGLKITQKCRYHWGCARFNSWI